jgi:hypothetical protein
VRTEMGISLLARNSAPRKALDFSGCKLRPQTGSFHPKAIEVGSFSSNEEHRPRRTQAENG